MNKKYIIILILIITPFLFRCQNGGIKEVKQYTIEQFMNKISMSGSSFSYDEKSVLFTSDKSGIYNAYTVQVESGELKQITHSDSTSIYAISFFPKDNRILFRSDQNGNEIYHIYLQNDEKSIQDITPYNNARAVFYGWSYDEKSFFFTCNKRNPSYMDIYEMDIETFQPDMIYQNDAGYQLGAISNNKQFLAFNKLITDHNSDIYLYNRETEEMKHLTLHEGDINYFPITFSIDSKSLYFLTDEQNEFTYLKRYDIEFNTAKIVEKAEWDIMSAYFSRNGKYRVIRINNDARTEIKVNNEKTNEPIKLPQLPYANITSVNISKSENWMTFYVNGSRTPNNLYIYNFETEQYIKLTESMNPEINIEDLVEGQVVRYKSFDDLDIPAILYKPHQIKPGEKVPALVSVHGGPGGQARIGYNELKQYLVNHGYVIIDVNNRGSSGYGKTFYKLDDLKHGEDDLDDCVEAKKFLASLGYVDTTRVGIQGGSYGGYMVLAALTFRPNDFAVGVDLCGISNWVRTLKNTPPWWESFKDALYKELGNPETDEEYLYSISPLFHADNINKPLMVLQGANDPRVLKVESDEIVEIVKKKGIPVEYVLFEDEGHRFVKKENIIKGYKAILNFLDQYLKE
ncbi:prolyl oligopeptidase family serine peptidase [Candidatus Latescibacterota bacterium]